jgi:hypothetical protein
LKHCVYIRFSYTDFPLFLKRLDVIKSTAVPSLLAQSGEFDVQVQVSNHNHAKIVSSQTPFRSVLKFEFEGYDIQTRHDSDDILLPGYIKKIQSFYDGTPKIVTFQIKKFDWSTGLSYDYFSKYTESSCSAFSSFLCPPENLNIYSAGHRELSNLAPAHVVNDSFCFATVHGANTTTKISDKEKPFSPGHV